MRPGQHLPLLVIGGAFLAGGLVGGGIAIGAAQDQEAVPTSCIEALDQADAIIMINGEVADNMLTMFKALEVNPLDSEATRTFGTSLTASAEDLGTHDYGTPAQACREAAK